MSRWAHLINDIILHRYIKITFTTVLASYFFRFLREICRIVIRCICTWQKEFKVCTQPSPWAQQQYCHWYCFCWLPSTIRFSIRYCGLPQLLFVWSDFSDLCFATDSYKSLTAVWWTAFIMKARTCSQALFVGDILLTIRFFRWRCLRRAGSSAILLAITACRLRFFRYK